MVPFLGPEIGTPALSHNKEGPKNGALFGTQNWAPEIKQKRNQAQPKNMPGVAPIWVLLVGSCGRKLIMTQGTAACNANQQPLSCTPTTAKTTAATTTTFIHNSTAARLWRTIVMAAFMALFWVPKMALEMGP